MPRRAALLVKTAARIAPIALLLVGIPLAAVPFLELVGLALHRHATSALTVAGAAIVLVGAPPLGVVFATPRLGRPVVFPVALILWAVMLHLVLPVYFPGERREAVATGLGVLGLGTGMFGISDRLVRALPDEPALATPEVAEASPIVVPAPPAGGTLSDDQIALPYEGEGRSLSVPVLWGHEATELDIDMMLDTGATYTTLSTDTLARLGIHLSDTDPVIDLHTANGERQAHVVLLDSLWLGDLRVDGVAVASCDDCASKETGGLLGLNVTGGFNLAIDADRREVVFTRRARFDRKLDVKPFVDLTATFAVFRGGRVEADVHLANHAPREVKEASAAILCAGTEWTVPFPAIPSGVTMDTKRRLPSHTPCDAYEITLHEAFW